MKHIKAILFLTTGLIVSNCSSQKIATINLRPGITVPVEVKKISFSKDTLYGKIKNLTGYEIINEDSTFLRPINILNHDSLISKIKYPEIAIRAGVEGMVLLQLTFDEKNKINKMFPVSNIGAGLEESVMNSIKNFRFSFDEKERKKKVLLLIIDFQIVNRYYPSVKVY